MFSIKLNKWVYLRIAGLLLTVIMAAVFFFFRSKEVSGRRERGLEVTAQPGGELRDIPGEMSFYFSRSFVGAEGIGIPADSMGNYIEIDPPSPASGIWASERRFEMRFLKNPLPEVRYDIKMKRLPLMIEAPKMPTYKFWFATPKFGLNSIVLKSVVNEMAQITICFNYPPETDNIERFIEIRDSKKQNVKISNVRIVNEHQLIITVPVASAPQQYAVTVKKGLKSKLGVSLRDETEKLIPVGFKTGPMTVENARAEEIDEGFMLSFRMSAMATHDGELEIYEDNLVDLVVIDPEIDYQVTASNAGVFVTADFMPDKSYKVTLKAGVSSLTGDILQQDYTQEFTMPKRKEKLQFVYRGRYFGKNGAWNLPLKVSQFPEVTIDVIYMPPENVLFWHLKEYGNTRNISNLGEAVVTGYKVTLENGAKEQVADIDLRELIKDLHKGLYLIEASGRNKSKYGSDRVAVVISDISLIAKWNDRTIFIWAMNSATLKPESGVDIEVRSSKNFLAGKGSTDNGGFCAIPVLKEGRDPYVIFAQKGNEWTYAHVSSLRLPMEAYDVSGESPDAPYNAYLYPERDLYRPGEEVKFGVLVREKGTYRGLAIPVRVNVRDPQGRDYLSLSGTTDNCGLREFRFPTAPSSPTGKYMLQLVIGDRTIYSSHVMVETFVPERMRAEQKFSEKPDIYKKINMKINAEFLFGAPASDEEYTIKLRAEETPMAVSGYYGYFFGRVPFGKDKAPSWESETESGSLDSKGKAEVDFLVGSSIKFDQPVRLRSLLTVTEGGSGRVTSRMTEKMAYTRPFYIGIKPTGSRIAAGVPMEVKGILLGQDHSLYTGKAKLYYRVYRLSYYYNYGYDDDYYYDDYYWSARVNKLPVTSKKQVTVADGKFSFNFTPNTNYNDYLVEVVDEGNGTVSQAKISGWGWWYGGEEKVQSPEVIPIRLDKKEYDAGDEVKVEALVPFDGNVLWTVELDTVYITEWSQAKGEVASWSFKVPKGVSTVYVSALLVRSGGNYMVQRGFGVQRVRIRPASLKLDMTLETPDKIKPGEELTVKVRTGGQFKGTIAVVDEGILQITDFQTPDPFSGILRDLRLYINSAESFGWIMKKFMDRTGGDFAAREKEFPEARFARIVSSWSGILESGRDGVIIYKVKIPEYNGKLRVMAVGASDSRFGSCQADVIVKSDVIVTPTIPRFMYTGDEFSFPVTLINTTSTSRSVSLSVTPKGFSVKGDRKASVALKAQEKVTQWVECIAGEDPGSLEMTIDASTQGMSYKDQFTIPLYPSVPFITETEYHDIKSGGKLDLKEYFNDWYPRAHQARVMVSVLPGLSRLNHFQYVIHYPYGCIEQTSTSTLVLLRLSSLLPAIAPEIEKEKYTSMVNHGINRLVSMQTISGGFAYWPGNSEPCNWGSGYAALVLLEARKAGFVVPEGALNAALNYLDAMPEKSGLIYYVLARGGVLQKKPEAVDRVITLAQKGGYNALGMLWAAGTAFESGRTEQAKSILRAALSRTPENTRRYSDDFYSRMQYDGIKLYMIENIEPGTEAEKQAVLQVSQDLSGKWSWYYSTQDLAWNLLSLGLYADKHPAGGQLGELRMNGKVQKPRDQKAVTSWTLSNPGNSGEIEIKSLSGSDLFVSIENKGFSKTRRAFEASSTGLVIEKTLLSYSGSAVTSARQGDILLMKIAVKTVSGYYDNVAVEASLPGGLEIENPRLGRGDLPQWTSDSRNMWMPDYVDVRDDRVIIFGRLSYGLQYYYVLLRAVTPGKYFLPPASAVIMYDPEKNARTGAGSFDIYKR